MDGKHFIKNKRKIIKLKIIFNYNKMTFVLRLTKTKIQPNKIERIFFSMIFIYSILAFDAFDFDLLSLPKH